MAFSISARFCQTIASKCTIPSCLSQTAVRRISTQKKPTKPINGFFLYLSKVRPDLSRNNPDKKVTELTSLASRMYKDLQPTEKQKLKLEADRLALQYKAELEKWQKSLSEEEKKQLAAEHAKMKIKKKTRKNRKICKEFNKPKRPLSPFLIFNKEFHRLQAISGETNRDLVQVTKKGAALWKTMTEDEKKAYNDVYKKHKEQYDAALVSWEQDMFEKGHHSVIRKPVLQKLVGPKPRKVAKKRPSKVAKKSGVRASKAVSAKAKKPMSKNTATNSEPKQNTKSEPKKPLK